MKKPIIQLTFYFLLVSFLITSNALAQPLHYIAPESSTSPIEVTPVSILDKVTYYANMYNVSAQDIYATLDCESLHFIDPTIQSRIVGIKGREKSFGYAQIHLTDHPDITYEEAIDPDFAINYIASNWKEHKSWWSCAKILGL